MKTIATLFGFSLLIITGIQAQQIPAENIVLHLSFNDNVLQDLSENQHEIIDHQTAFGTGVNDEGLLLEGDENFLEIPHTSSLEIPNELSISQWYLHQDQIGNGFYSLVEQSANEFGGHSRYGTWIFNQSTVMSCIEPDLCPNGSTLCQRCITSNTTLEEGNWYHIVSTYDGNSQKIYINGVLDSQQSYNDATGISVREYPLTIGTDMYDGSPLYLNATMDEIRLMNIALNEIQIMTLFQEFMSSSIHGKSRIIETKIFPNPANQYIEISSPINLDQLTIYDRKGAKVLEREGNIIEQLNISDLENGLYTIFLSGEGAHINRRFSVIN
jgi:hypothetical protein